MRKFYLICLILIGMTALSWAKEDAVQIGLWHPLQLFSEDDTVSALRWDIFYGVNSGVDGLDIGFVNKTKLDENGVQFGEVNLVDGDFHGWQDGLVNLVGGDFVGLQEGFFNSVDGNFYGMQYGFINKAKGIFKGFQLGWLWNTVTQSMRGLQLGLVNTTDDLDGVQIGLININGNEHPLGFFPLINASF